MSCAAAQQQLIAEELGVALSRVTLIQCDTALTPDQGTTSGAQSHPTNVNLANLAPVGATARETLFALASKRLGVPVDQLTVNDGVVSLTSDGSKKVGYGELIGGRKFNLALNSSAKRKHPGTWTVLGTPVPRVDIPTMVVGQFEYVHNVRVPGMLHGRVVRPPSVDATLIGVDDAVHRALWRASACSRTTYRRSSSPGRCVRRNDSRTRSHTNRSWTRSRRS